MTSAPAPEPAVKADGRRMRGDRNRRTVLESAVRIASVEGIEGLTIGRVAEDAGVPKSSLQMLFKEREALQLQTLELAATLFADEIVRRLPRDGNGMDRLGALIEAWFDVTSSSLLPGGCLVTAAATELRARPGVLHDAVIAHRSRWQQALLGAARRAAADGSLGQNVDPEQIVFELMALQAMAGTVSIDGSEQNRARRTAAGLIARSRRPPA